MISSARQHVRAVDRDLLLTDVTTMNDLVRDATGDERFRTTLLSLFAGVALLLAALGIYGVLAYFVSQRSRESLPFGVTPLDPTTYAAAITTLAAAALVACALPASRATRVDPLVALREE